MELELHDEGQEIARVRHVRRNVVFRARIEVLFRARDGRHDALVLAAQFPPRCVVVLGLDLAREDLPAPLVDELAEGQECDLVERHLHLLIDDEFLARLDVADQVDRMQVPGRHRQVDGVADRFVKAVVRTALEHVREVAVPEVVIDVSELVVHRGQVFFGRRRAHLDAHVLRVAVYVPGARVAHDIAVARAHQHGALPERFGKLGEADRPIEVLGRLHHLRRVVPLVLERLVDI